MPSRPERAHLPQQVGGAARLLPRLRRPGRDLPLREVPAQPDEVALRPRSARSPSPDVIGPAGTNLRGRHGSHRNPRRRPGGGDELESVGEVGVADEGEQPVGYEEPVVRGADRGEVGDLVGATPGARAGGGGPGARVGARTRGTDTARRAAAPRAAASVTGPWCDVRRRPPSRRRRRRPVRSTRSPASAPTRCRRWGSRRSPPGRATALRTAGSALAAPTTAVLVARRAGGSHNGSSASAARCSNGAHA